MFNPRLSLLLLSRLLLYLSKRARYPIPNRHPAQQGLTLIECIVAIVVIAITVVAVTPPVFLATATRIQSRRAEQANQIAQAEVDRIRTIIERGVYTAADLPITTGSATGIETFGAGTSMASTILSTSTQSECATKYPQVKPTAANQLVPVDIDGDCKAEYMMQVFRSEGCVPALEDASKPYSFMVGVRVYTYVPGETFPALSSERATLSLTTGRRDQGPNSRKPLQVIYSKVSRNNNDKSFECVAK